MSVRKQGRIHIGVGGWTFEPWRGAFYPDKLPQKQELEYASRHLTSIEVNGTYYRAQTPATFMKWHDETPDDFVFALKAPRYATNRKVLAESGTSVERFFESGPALLKGKLGPINWQFMETKKFDPEDFAAFLSLLPKQADGTPLRHAVEVRHDSFRTPEFTALLRAHGVAAIISADGKFPQIADLTAPFVYARIMGTSESEPLGYSDRALDEWAERACDWAAGRSPKGLDYVGDPAPEQPRDVYLYVISGEKRLNPAAAMALIERVNARLEKS